MANANGEGSIYKRIATASRPDTSVPSATPTIREMPKRHMVYGKTRTEVRDKMKAVRDRLDSGAAVKDSKRTVADWLAHWRATTLAASDRKESTRELYGNLGRRHLERALRRDSARSS